MHMTDLEARLAQADGAAVRDGLLQRLEQLERRLRQQLAASVPRNDYARVAAAAEAAQAAQAVLRDWPVGTDAPRPTPSPAAGLQFLSPTHRSAP